MDEKEAMKLGFQFARDHSFQLITLSTGIIALTVTFIKEVLKTVHSRAVWRLKCGWLLHLLSILFGIWATMGLTGTLLDPNTPNVIQPSTRLPAIAQVLLFLGGTSLIIWYGLDALKDIGSGDDPKPTDEKKPNPKKK